MLSKAAGAGYEVEGIEPSPLADTVAAHTGLTVHCGTLQGARSCLRLKEYGVITYFHVLEHVHDPVAELQTARELLSTDGILAVEVPFFDTLSWRIFGTRHRHVWQCHRSYFNVRSLSELFRRTGYKVLAWEKVPYMISLGWLLKRLGLGVLAKALPRRVARVAMRIDLGDVLLMTAQRM